jgi:hypothetical protein
MPHAASCLTLDAIAVDDDTVRLRVVLLAWTQLRACWAGIYTCMLQHVALGGLAEGFHVNETVMEFWWHVVGSVCSENAGPQKDGRRRCNICPAWPSLSESPRAPAQGILGR